jgi:uncharacterized GH25 family protein
VNRFRHRVVRCVLVGSFFAAASPLCAHDFWIQPSSFAPAVGATVALRLLVGEHGVGEPVPRDPARIVRFDAVGPDAAAGAVPTIGYPGDEPAGVLALPSPGLWLAAYRSKPSFLELEPAQFAEYLRSEGLDRALAERDRRGEQSLRSREFFSRCAKALVRVGGRSGRDRVLGLTLELVAEGDLATLGSAKVLPVQLLYEGQPLQQALVIALPLAEPTALVQARTDRNGRVRLALSRPGAWLVKTVHMIRLSGDPRAEWESFWASLTLEVAGDGPAPH